MRNRLCFAAAMLAAAFVAHPCWGEANFEKVVEEAPVLLEAGKVEEAVGMMLSLDTLVGRSIEERKTLARKLHEMHNALIRRDESEWLLKLDEHARKLFPSERTAGADFGEACIMTGRFERAERELRAAAGQRNLDYPESRGELARVHLLLARAALVQGHIDDAKKAIAAAIESEPSAAQLYYTKAQVMLRAGDWDEAGTALKTAFRLDPDLAQPVDYLVRASCMMREAAIEQETGRNRVLEQAEKVIKQGLSRFPTAPGLHCSLGQVYLAQQKPAKAFYQFQYEIMLSGPKSSYTQEARDRIEIMTALLDKDRNSETPAEKNSYLKIAYGAAALMKMQPGGYEAAIENIRKGLRANGDDCLPLQVLLGRALAGLKQYEKAAEVFRTVVRIDPHFVPGYVDLGDVCEELGDREGALKHYATALTLDKHNWRVREMLNKVGRMERRPEQRTPGGRRAD